MPGGSWRCLALLCGALAAVAAVVVAVVPLRFDYGGIVGYLRTRITEQRATFCRICMDNCLWTAKLGAGFFHSRSPTTSTLMIPTHECPAYCSGHLTNAIRQMLQSSFLAEFMQHELDVSVIALPLRDQAQAKREGFADWKRAEQDVGLHHPDQKCTDLDASWARPKPADPSSSGHQHHGPLDAADDAEPVPDMISPDSSGQQQSGPPSARDNWAADEPFHTPFQPDWLCVQWRRASGMSQAVAERRCRFRPFHRTQPGPPRPALLLPGSAPVPEPAAPWLAPNLGLPANGLLRLKGGL
ncbi:MAG: hypothetical protein M1826_003915 [Phylliscum demangeonii]|nr:MAG: hypothetical protein M1826_003915 [Phylliscum demangeonii]